MLNTQTSVVELTRVVGNILNDVHTQNEMHLKTFENMIIEKSIAQKSEQEQDRFKELQSLEDHVLSVYKKFNVPGEYHIKLINRIQKMKIDLLTEGIKKTT